MQGYKITPFKTKVNNSETDFIVKHEFIIRKFTGTVFYCTKEGVYAIFSEEKKIQYKNLNINRSFVCLSEYTLV